MVVVDIFTARVEGQGGVGQDRQEKMLTIVQSWAQESSHNISLIGLQHLSDEADSSVRRPVATPRRLADQILFCVVEVVLTGRSRETELSVGLFLIILSGKRGRLGGRFTHVARSLARGVGARQRDAAIADRRRCLYWKAKYSLPYEKRGADVRSRARPRCESTILL